jgi:transcriptional regulator with XRE-family HTH domain
MDITAYGDSEAIAALGTHLREERLRRNVTIAHLASLVGCSRATLAKLEAGDSGVALRVLARVLGVMGLERRLLELVPDPGPPIDFKAAARPPRQRAGRRK